MTYLNSNDVYELCNKHQWFTSGSINQYNKVFDYVNAENKEETIEEIIRKTATMIWICSSDKITEKEIYDALFARAFQNKCENRKERSN